MHIDIFILHRNYLRIFFATLLYTYIFISYSQHKEATSEVYFGDAWPVPTNISVRTFG